MYGPPFHAPAAAYTVVGATRLEDGMDEREFRDAFGVPVPRTPTGRKVATEGLDDGGWEDRLAAILAIETEASELDVAWQAAEAALPEGWRVLGVYTVKGGATFEAHTVDPAKPTEAIVVTAATPAAALRALGAKLRETHAATA